MSALHARFEVVRTRTVEERVEVVAPNAIVARLLARDLPPTAWQTVQTVALSYRAEEVRTPG